MTFLLTIVSDSYIDHEGRRLVSGVDDAAGQPGSLTEEDGRLGGHIARTGRHSAAHPGYLGDSLSVLSRVERLDGRPGGVDQGRGLLYGGPGQGDPGPHQLPGEVEAGGDGAAHLVSQLLR